MEDSNLFVIAFGTEGRELVVNLTELRDEGVLEKLYSEDAETPIYDNKMKSLNMFQIRVRANSHRYIETYSINIDSNITEEDINQWFEDDCMGLINLLREKGEFINQMSNKAPFEWTYKKPDYIK